MVKRAIALSMGLLGVVSAGCGSNATRIFVTWELQLADGTPVSCQTGETIEIMASNVVESNIPCVAGNVTTGSVPSGHYGVVVSLIAADGVTVESTTTIDSIIASGATNDIGHVIFQVTGTGSADFSWSLRMGGAPVNCASGETVELDFGVTPVPTFPCTALGGTVDIAEGTYDVFASLVLGSTVESMSSAIPVTVVAGQTTTVGPIVFIVP